MIIHVLGGSHVTTALRGTGMIARETDEALLRPGKNKVKMLQHDVTTSNKILKDRGGLAAFRAWRLHGRGIA